MITSYLELLNADGELVLSSLGLHHANTQTSTYTSTETSTHMQTHASTHRQTMLARGVQFAKNDFGSVFGSVLQKNCGFLFGFGFKKINCGFGFFGLFCVTGVHSSVRYAGAKPFRQR